jgi:hypothetical protein
MLELVSPIVNPSPRNSENKARLGLNKKENLTRLQSIQQKDEVSSDEHHRIYYNPQNPLYQF